MLITAKLCQSLPFLSLARHSNDVTCRRTSLFRAFPGLAYTDHRISVPLETPRDRRTGTLE